MQDPKQPRDQRMYFLRQCEIFQHLTPAELEIVARKAPDRRIRAGECVFSNREQAMAFYVLKKGKVKLVRISAEGNERIEDILYPCDIFGLFFDAPDAETQDVDIRAEALMDSVVCGVDRNAFIEMIRSSPTMALAVTRTLVDQLRETQRRLDRLHFDSSRLRLAKHLLELAEQHGRIEGDHVLLELPLNQEELGELIGASRVTVNQLLGEFKREAVLEVGKGTYALKMDQLRALL